MNEKEWFQLCSHCLRACELRAGECRHCHLRSTSVQLLLTSAARCSNIWNSFNSFRFAFDAHDISIVCVLSINLWFLVRLKNSIRQHSCSLNGNPSNQIEFIVLIYVRNIGANEMRTTESENKTKSLPLSCDSWQICQHTWNSKRFASKLETVMSQKPSTSGMWRSFNIARSMFDIVIWFRSFASFRFIKLTFPDAPAREGCLRSMNVHDKRFLLVYNLRPTDIIYFLNLFEYEIPYFAVTESLKGHFFPRSVRSGYNWSWAFPIRGRRK